MTTPRHIQLFGTADDSIVDGPGLRIGVFVQGCSHRCPGCHNPESQPAEGGEVRLISQLVESIKGNSLVHDVTLSGGEPFEQAAACTQVARLLKKEGYGIWTYTGYLLEDLLAVASQAPSVQRAGLGGTNAELGTRSACSLAPLIGNLVTLSQMQTAASRYEQAGVSQQGRALLDPQGVHDLLLSTDVLVDGPFVEKLHSYQLKWRGSSNQRLIDMLASRTRGAVVLWEPYSFVPKKPDNW